MADKGDNIIELDATECFTVEQALARAERLNFKKVAVLGFDDEDSFTWVMSRMTNAEALWLTQKAAYELVSDDED